MNDFFGRFFDYFGEEGEEEGGSAPEGGSGSKGFRHFG
jgi:hypothetical protein